MKLVNKKQMYIRRQIADTRIFKQNLNRNLDFTLSGKEFVDPFNIIPKRIYEDFNREEFKRHEIIFPIKIPIHYRFTYLPNQANRKILRQPTNPNFAAATGNQLLLSLSQHQDYNIKEKLEMLNQLANKPKVQFLDLENNELIKDAIQDIYKRLDWFTIDQLTLVIYSLDKMNFQNEEIFKKMKNIIFQKYPAFADADKNAFAKCFLVITKRFDLNSEEWELVKDQTARYLRNFSPNFIYEFSKMLIDNQIVTSYNDYLFEYHILMAFWKKLGVMQLYHINYLFRILNEFEYYNFDPEFYLEEMFPILRKKILKTQNSQQVQESIENLEEFSSKEFFQQETAKYIQIAYKRQEFIKHFLPRINNSELLEIVKSDIQKFKELKLKEKEIKQNSSESQNQEQTKQQPELNEEHIEKQN